MTPAPPEFTSRYGCTFDGVPQPVLEIVKVTWNGMPTGVVPPTVAAATSTPGQPSSTTSSPFGNTPVPPTTSIVPWCNAAPPQLRAATIDGAVPHVSDPNMYLST